MAVGGVDDRGRPGRPSTGDDRRVAALPPLRRRVSSSRHPDPSRRLAVRATAIGAGALGVGWLLGPEDGLIPVVVLAGLGLLLGVRWARVLWDRRTVGRRIRRLTGQVPVSLGGFRVAGSGYWLRPTEPGGEPTEPGGEPAAALMQDVGRRATSEPNAVVRHPGAPGAPGAETLPPAIAPTTTALGSAPRAGRGTHPADPAIPAVGPHAPIAFGPGVLPGPPPSPATVSGPAGQRPVGADPWTVGADPGPVGAGPWTVSGAPAPAPVHWPALPPVLWAPPEGDGARWVPVAANAPWLSTPGASGWRPANSGIGPFASGEEVELLVTPDAIWVSGRIVERYVRRDATVEPVGTEGLSITAGDAAMRRWVTLVPDREGDLDWLLVMLTEPPAPATPRADDTRSMAPGADPDQAKPASPDTRDHPHSVGDNARR